jgi:hypothetical protein
LRTAISKAKPPSAKEATHTLEQARIVIENGSDALITAVDNGYINLNVGSRIALSVI